jgi:predicted amidohydrolase YtcJ
MILRLFLFAIVSAMLIPTSRAQSTMVVLDARIWTGNPDKPWAEALIVSGDRLVFVGSDDEVRARVDLKLDDLVIIDARQRLLVPGFIDSHIHLEQGGSKLFSVQLRDAKSKSEFIHRIGKFVGSIPAGTWVTGGDWDHTTWGGELPERSWIDSVTSEHPIWINRLDGHMALANSAALAAAGVRSDQEDVEGGWIGRDAAGQLTGLFKDNAMSLISSSIPSKSVESRLDHIEAASAFVASHGVTSVHNVDGWASYELFHRARSEGRLHTRIYACAPLAKADELASFIASNGSGDEWIRTGCVKGYVDGSLGSQTAAFFEPFVGSSSDRGLLVESEEDLARMIRQADAERLQLAIHAIGDRANHILLNLFESMISSHGDRDRRARIEHAQHLAPEDIPRFAELGVIPSMQPYHAIDDGRWAEDLIGKERASTTYAFRSLIDTGARPTFGSDWYVAPPSPLVGIYAAVTRRTLDGANPEGWVPEQRISVEEALAAYTINAAYAAFEDDVKGSLQAGKLADFAIIDRDITRVPAEDIVDAGIDLTVVGGVIVFEKSQSTEDRTD